MAATHQPSVILQSITTSFPILIINGQETVILYLVHYWGWNVGGKLKNFPFPGQSINLANYFLYLVDKRKYEETHRIIAFFVWLNRKVE